jgi:hypothetical protein
MGQNSARIPWKEAELQKMLSDIRMEFTIAGPKWWSRQQQAH